MIPPPGTYPCHCCGNLTLVEESDYEYAPQRGSVCTYIRAICSDPIHARSRPVQRCAVCGWISDFYQEHDEGLHGRPNGVSLRDAQVNYRRIGAIRSDVLTSVRPPTAKEDTSTWRHLLDPQQSSRQSEQPALPNAA